MRTGKPAAAPGAHGAPYMGPIRAARPGRALIPVKAAASYRG
jgi:hypothetical protein